MHPSPTLNCTEKAYQRNAAAVVFLVSFLLASYFSLIVFHNHPYSQDEYVNLYQASIFLHGHLSMPVNPALRPLMAWDMLMVDGRIFSKYAPGFSLLLAPGVGLGLAGFINPLLSALTVLVLWATLRLVIPTTTASYAAFLLATNSYFLGYGGSYFAQPLMLLLTALVFYCFMVFQRDGNHRALLCAAACVSYGFLVRPLDALCLLIALAGALAHDFNRKHWRYFALMMVMVCVSMASLFLYNYILSGCLCVSPYPLWKGEYFSVWRGEFRIIDSHAHGFIDNINRVMTRYVQGLHKITWPVFTDYFLFNIGPLFLAMALIGFAFLRNRLSLMSALSVVSLVLLYNFHQTPGWPQYGARYWYPALAPLTLMMGIGLQHANAGLKRPLFLLLFTVLLASQIFRLKEDIDTYTARFELLQQVNTDIETRCPAPSIVILHKAPHVLVNTPGWDPFMKLRLRNTSFTGPRVFVRTAKDMRAIAPYFPGYAICNYHVFSSARITPASASLKAK